MRLVRSSAWRRGVAAVELAVVLPVLVLVAMGCVDLGRFGYHQIAVTNAARAGAEYGIMHPYTTSTQAAWMATIQQTARNELTGQTGCNPNSLTTTTTVNVESNGLRRIQVDATYSSFQTLVSWPGIPRTMTLRATVIMRSVR